MMWTNSRRRNRFVAIIVISAMAMLPSCARAEESCKAHEMNIEEQLEVARDASGEAALSLGIGSTDVEVQDRDGKTALGKDDPTQTQRAFRNLGSLDRVTDKEATDRLNRAQGILEDDWSFVLSDSSTMSRWSDRDGMTATITISRPDPAGSRNVLAEVTTACVPTAELPER